MFGANINIVGTSRDVKFDFIYRLISKCFVRIYVIDKSDVLLRHAFHYESLILVL